MIAYLDTSVLLRIILVEPDPLVEWNQIDYGVSSVLLRVEAQRALDRLYLRRELNPDEFASKRAQVGEALEKFILLPLDDATIDAASRPLNHQLRTLDALHLTTALRHRVTHSIDVFATHDQALAAAARANGFQVLGA